MALSAPAWRQGAAASKRTGVKASAAAVEPATKVNIAENVTQLIGEAGRLRCCCCCAPGRAPDCAS